MDESRLRSADGEAAVLDGSIHPFVSSVLYLDDGGASGAPTVVFDQKINGCEGHKAWLCFPNSSRLLLFDGSLLHGVVPHIKSRDSDSNPSATRLTLMIGWWDSQVHTTQYTPLKLGPNMIFNQNLQSKVQWPNLFAPLARRHLNDLQSHTPSPSINSIVFIDGNVWEAIGEKDRKWREKGNKCESTPASNGLIFVGNWFLNSKQEINNEILNSATFAKVDSCSKSTIMENLEWLSITDLKKLRGEL